MAEEKKYLSKLKLTSGDEYNFKDVEARQMISDFIEGIHFDCGTATTVVLEEELTTVLDCGTATAVID